MEGDEVVLRAGRGLFFSKLHSKSFLKTVREGENYAFLSFSQWGEF